jgi:hypothetical protein
VQPKIDLSFSFLPTDGDVEMVEGHYCCRWFESKRTDWELMAESLEHGNIQSVPIDREHRVKDIMKTWERLQDPKKNGRVVIKVDNGLENLLQMHYNSFIATNR